MPNKQPTRWHNMKIRILLAGLKGPQNKLDTVTVENCEALLAVTQHKLFHLLRAGPLCDSSFEAIKDSVALATTAHRDAATLAEMLRRIEASKVDGLRAR